MITQAFASQPSDPSPTLKLTDVLASTQKPKERTYLAVLGNNLGYQNLNLTVRLADLHSQTFVYSPQHSDDEGEVAQRNLDPAHARGLGQYALSAAIKVVLEAYRAQGRIVGEEVKALSAMVGPQSARGTYSVIGNIRADSILDRLSFTALETGAASVPGSPYIVRVPDEVWALLEGQHRREGWHLVDRWLSHVDQYGRYPTPKDGLPAFFGLKGGVTTAMAQLWRDVRAAFNEFTVTVQLYLGLTIEQERQLFSDFNSKGRLVKSDITYQYDRGNAIVNYMHEGLTQLDLIKPDDGVNEGSGQLTLSEAAGVCSIAFINRTNPKGALPNLIEERAPIVTAMFQAIEQVPGFGSDDESVINQVVVLKAIAKLVYDLGFAKTKSDEEREANDEALQTLLADLGDVNFSHDNWIWRYYDLSATDQEVVGAKGLGGDIRKYLPHDAEGQLLYKEVGFWDPAAKRFAFSVKHNDVYPVIADMIRFRLGLPSRFN